MEVIWGDLFQDVSSKERRSPTSSLPSPSPELTHAQVLSQEQLSQQWLTHSKDQAASTNSDFLPSPTAESPHVQPWTLGQPFHLQQPVINDKDNVATTIPTPLPSPPLDLSIGASWIESEHRVFDSLFESHTGHAFSGYGTAPLSSLDETSAAFEYGASDALPGHDTLLSSAKNELGITHLSAALELDTPQLNGDTLMDTFAISGYGTGSSCLRVGAVLNVEQSADNHMASSFISTEDLVQALVTPVLELFEVGNPDDKVEPVTPLCVRPDDLVFEVVTKSETIEKGSSTSTGGSVLLSPQDTSVTVLAPTVASRRVRFDMTPHIKVLDSTRVTGPPKEPDEEHIDDIMRRARWEYRWDKDLRQEHKLSKRASFNAHLHAAFPVDTQEEQASDEQQNNQQSSEGCLSKKRNTDDGDEDDFLTDERHVKKHRTVEHTSSSLSSAFNFNPSSNEHTVEQLGVREIMVNNHTTIDTQFNKHTTIDHVTGSDTIDDEAYNVVSAIKKHAAMESEADDVLAQHPDFDEMIKDDLIGRSYRLFRWNLYYPATHNEDFEEDELSQEDSDDVDFDDDDNDDGMDLYSQ